MKKMYVRLFALVLALLLVIPMVACADEETPVDPGKEQGSEKEPGEEEKQKIDHGVPSKNFDATVNVLHYDIDGNHESWIPWDEIATETDADGDKMTKAVFDRNLWLEENYGIEVTNTYEVYTKMPGIISNCISSGDDEWQVFDHFCYHLSDVYGREYFMNLDDLEYVDFDHPWWVADSVETLSLGKYVEFAATDMLLLDKGATNCVFYNIPMANELSLSGFYDDVRNKDWTIEKIAEYAEYANLDLDANNEMDGNDRYGMACGDDPVLMLYICSGNRFINKDENGDFYYQYGDEHTITTMINIFDTILYGEFFYNNWLHRGEAKLPSFKQDESLFDFSMAKNCRSYRNMESDYGILPVPMADENQEEYQSWVHSYHDSLIAVPMTVEDTAPVGAMIELLSWYSYYNIQDVFYNEIICGRGVRDDESVEMLKIIFSNRVYDMGMIKDVDSFTDKVLRYTATGDTNLASHFKQYESKLNEMIDELNDLKDYYN